MQGLYALLIGEEGDHNGLRKSPTVYGHHPKTSLIFLFQGQRNAAARRNVKWHAEQKQEDNARQIDQESCNRKNLVRGTSAHNLVRFEMSPSIPGVHSGTKMHLAIK